MTTNETMSRSRITMEIQPPVARICLNNPPLNVINIAMMEELAVALGEIEARNDLSIILLSGAGKAFSVGVDVADHTPDKVEIMLTKFHAVIRALIGTKKVTIACRAWPLSGRRGGTGHGVRHGIYRRQRGVGVP